MKAATTVETASGLGKYSLKALGFASLSTLGVATWVKKYEHYF